MTILQFIKSQLSEDSQLGDFARDIQGDKDFPAEMTEEKILSYLDFKTCQGATSDIFRKFLKTWKIKKHVEADQLNLDIQFSPLRAERWKFYKEYFPVEKVILVGESSDIYKVYCIDASNKKALFFDIKSSASLNDIPIKDEEEIYIGNLTQQVSVGEAITLLESCSYDTPIKPDSQRFIELIEFLKANKLV